MRPLKSAVNDEMSSCLSQGGGVPKAQHHQANVEIMLDFAAEHMLPGEQKNKNKLENVSRPKPSRAAGWWWHATYVATARPGRDPERLQNGK